MLTPAQIRQLREALGWTRPQMAAYLGVKSVQAIYHWEHGMRHPRYRHLVKLNELLKRAQKERGLILAS